MNTFLKGEFIMSKVAVVYWGGTGNTEAMASAVLSSINENGGEGVMLTAAEFDASMVDSYDAIAFGCPSMGAEQLEESEFEPMFTACGPKLSGKKIALFGSYGRGDGEWMRAWKETCRDNGAKLVCDCVICNEAPDEDGIASCNALGKALL